MQSQSNQDRENIYRFLYEIWSNEFRRSMAGMDHQRRIMKDDLDDTAHHFIAVDDSDRILGCVRANILGKTKLSDSLQRHLQPEKLIELFTGNGVGYASHFAVAPEARGKTVASLLIAALYQHYLNEGVLVGISYCALNLVSFYYQLGYRPYTENFRIDVGIRVPVVHCLRDFTYLNEIKSPLARICIKDLNDHGATARKIAERFPDFKRPGFSRIPVHHLWARLAHATSTDTTRNDHLFFGLSAEEQQIVGHRLSEIAFASGEYVYHRGETERGMGVLLSGCLGVEVAAGEDSRIINVVFPGEPFGEIASISGVRRTASLVALENSQAFLLPFDFLDRIGRADMGLGLKLAKRLLKTIAGRFVNLTDEAVLLAGPSRLALRVNRPAEAAPADAGKVQGRAESYRFRTLGDQEGESKRLISQATIGADLEFAVLGGLGLADGAKVLDLGSGPGVTSLLIAQRLPKAIVTGVEPEDLLRQKAKTLVASQGLENRCRFLKGTGDRIPLGNGEVDFSYARLLFQHLSNPLEVLSEMRRVTRQGGIITILDVDDRSNIIHPAPKGLEDLEKRIAQVQAANGGDRYVGRKLHGYMHATGLHNIAVEAIPITAAVLGREAFFSIVYSFKRQVLERAGELDEQTAAIFAALEESIAMPTTFAMTTVFAAHATVP
ncbi:MAG: GNAT family N-acetyltransferase [Desulforhopalus sp.]|nr:GNAT family N-acetyltransferase [Desulforhopalus sp.]